MYFCILFELQKLVMFGFLWALRFKRAKEYPVILRVIKLDLTKRVFFS